jgi:hypothetical protein
MDGSSVGTSAAAQDQATQDPSAQDPSAQAQYPSARRIAEIGQAIEDLASGDGGTEPIVARVAALWGELAELDPELARRLAGYQALLRSVD